VGILALLAGACTYLTTMTTSTKRARITYCDQLKITDKLDQGEASVDVANEFKVSAACISRIKKKTKNKLRVFAISENSKVLKKRKSLKTTTFPELEQALFTWFCQKRQMGEPISDPLLSEKALIFNEKLNGPKTFKVSQMYYSRNFKFQSAVL